MEGFYIFHLFCPRLLFGRYLLCCYSMQQLVSCLRRVLCNQNYSELVPFFFFNGNSDMKVLFTITRVYHTPAYFTNSSVHSHVSANSLRTYPGFCLDLLCFLLAWRTLTVGSCSGSAGVPNRFRFRTLSKLKPPPPERCRRQPNGLLRLVSKRN